MKAALAALRLDLVLAWRRRPGPLLAAAALLVALAAATRPAAPPPAPAAADDPRRANALHAFRRVLLPQSEQAAAQQRLLDAAERHGLAVGNIEYGREGEAADGFSRAVMHLPLSGRYADLRAWMAEVLAAQPSLSFRQLAIERKTDAAGSQTVACRLKAEFLLAEAAP